MQVRTSRKKQGGKLYEYPQLVESYRRKSDGMPMHRVVANLGELPPIELNNLRIALAAARKGKKVVVASALSHCKIRPVKPAANLCYLDIAVMLELWCQWGLDELFDEIMPAGDAEVAPSAVVAALTIQRCVAPGSKLYAERWFPRTALPELQGVWPGNFNNTRVHRVLDDLDQNRYLLMAKLPRLYAAREGSFASLFLDISDTWFVGHGPGMAERAKTKEGLIRRKIGIVLLCNEYGYPLRWEVIRGKQADSEALGNMVRSISGLSWVGDTPLVCDRAMGKTAQIRELLAAKIIFLTALTVTEFSAYTDAIPHQPLADFFPGTGNDRDHIARAAKLVEDAGMEKVEDNLYVLDLGVVERSGDKEVADGNSSSGDDIDQTVRAVRLGREVRDAVANGRASSLAAAGRALGLGKGVTAKYLRLTNLREDIQLAVLNGEAPGLTIAKLLDLETHTESEKQRDEFDRLVRVAAGRGDNRPRKSLVRSSPSETASDSVRVRAVAYFNPDMFLEQRRTAQRHLDEIDAFVTGLNRRLESPRSKLTEPKIHVEVNQKLRRYDLIEAYEVSVEKRQSSDGGRKRYVVQLTLKPKEWARRRRYDGFSLLVAHPDIKHSGIELCHLYRAKDKVEKDFEIIKGLVKLRPVRHRLDAKVRAHVDICMLGLLLERTLDRRLGETSTSHAALEELASCHLNRYHEGEDTSLYSVTELTKQQDAILRTLKLRHLADDEEVADRIMPR
jgi:hypothetical protein